MLTTAHMPKTLPFIHPSLSVKDVLVILLLQYILFSQNICFSFIFVGFLSIFVDWQKLRCSLIFEIVVLVLACDFCCYLCLSLCTKFCGFIEPMKNLKIAGLTTLGKNTCDMTSLSVDIQVK